MKKIISLILAIVVFVTSIITYVSMSVKAVDASQNIVFDFENDAQGFVSSSNPAACEIAYNSSEKAMEGKMLAAWGSIVLQKELSTTIKGEDYKTVKISIKNPTNKNVSALFTFADQSDQNMIDDPTISSGFTLSNSDDSYKDYYIQIGENNNWVNEQTIKFIRVQLCLATGDMTPQESIFIGEVSLLTQRTEGPQIDPVGETDLVYTFEENINGFISAGNPAASEVVYNATEKAVEGKMLSTWGSVVIQKQDIPVFKGTDFKTIMVTLKNPTSKRIKGRLTFATTTDREIVNKTDSFIHFDIPTNSDYFDYYFQISENNFWKNSINIDTIRIQLCCDDGQMTPSESLFVKNVSLFINTKTGAPVPLPEPPKGPYKDITFTFDDGNEGFGVPSFLASTVTSSASGGALNITTTAPTKALVQAPLDDRQIDGTVANTISLKIKNGAAAKSIFVQFATAGAGGYYADMETEENTLQGSLDGGNTNDYVTVDIDMSANKKWSKSNDINMIRFIFLDQYSAPLAANKTISIDSIRIYNKPLPTEVIIDFSKSLNGFAPPLFVKNCVAEYKDSSMQLRNQQIGKLMAQGFLNQSVMGTYMNKLTITIKNTSKASTMVVAFGTATDQGANVDKDSHIFKIALDKTSTDKYINYEIPVYDNKYWKTAKDINFIRLVIYGEAMGNMPVGAAINVKKIRFWTTMKSPNTGMENTLPMNLFIVVVAALIGISTYQIGRSNKRKRRDKFLCR